MHTQGTMRAAIYARVSTDEQTRGFGLGIQEEAGRKYADSRGWSVVDVYKDEGVSGSLAQRPEFDRLIADARAGRIDAVIVHRFDRVARTVGTFYRLAETLKEHEVGIASVTQDIDTTSTGGKAMLGVLATFAEMEWNTIRERTQGGLQKKAEAGGWPGGQPPYGYRIEGKGKRGSHLVIDDREAEVLREARRMLVEEGLSTPDVAARLNAQGLMTRSGRPWSYGNLRNKLVSPAVTEAKVIFRNASRTGSGHSVKVGKDGTPRHGESVTIGLPPIFTPDEVAELRRALGRSATGKPKPQASVYPLSTRLYGLCGSHYSGMRRPGGRKYRCSGRRPKFEGAPVCDCEMLDADAVEAAVWGDVVKLLSDPDRLKTMAAEWVGLAGSDQATHADRIADLDRQIRERQDALNRAVEQQIRADSAALATALQAAVTKLAEEVEQLQEMRAEAEAWQAESAAAEQRARDLETLATVARDRLADMTPTEQAEVLALLDVRVTVTGPTPKTQVGQACGLAQWFVDHGRLVPGPLTDEAWAKVEPIVKAWEPSNHRLLDHRRVIDGVLFKLRAGCTWREVPAEYGKWSALHTRAFRWLQAGVWADLINALPNEGTPVPAAVPPLRIEGRVDPRTLAGRDDSGDLAASVSPAR
ncbi:hypothetical protein SUDANB106_04122 [Streptomyces sp. enrichment culture]